MNSSSTKLYKWWPWVILAIFIDNIKFGETCDCTYRRPKYQVSVYRATGPLVIQDIPSGIWIAFDTCKHLIWAHCIKQARGPEKSSVLSIVHAFNGCDTVSAFYGKGKISACDAWTSFDDTLTHLLTMMMDPQRAVHFDAFMSAIQRFVVVIYNRTRSVVNINKAPHNRVDKQALFLRLRLLCWTYKENHIRRFGIGKCFRSKPWVSEPFWLRLDQTQWSLVGISVGDASQSNHFLSRVSTRYTCNTGCRKAYKVLKVVYYHAQ